MLSPSDISNDERPIGKGEFSVVTQGERSGPVGRIAAEDKPECRQRNLFLSLFPRNPLSGPHQKTGCQELRKTDHGSHPGHRTREQIVLKQIEHPVMFPARQQGSWDAEGCSLCLQTPPSGPCQCTMWLGWSQVLMLTSPSSDNSYSELTPIPHHVCVSHCPYQIMKTMILSFLSLKFI